MTVNNDTSATTDAKTPNYYKVTNPISEALLKEWHPTRNHHLDPHRLNAGSNHKVWWLGECGHEWEAIVRNRTARGDTCPICSGNMVLAGFNDLATLNPVLASEWHPTKNHPLTPEQVTVGSGRKVYWQCAKGHDWKTTISSRHSGKHQCPYCTGRNAVLGVNDLLSLNPALAAEWHPVKNNGLLPSAVKEQPNLNVWWMRHKKHEWTSDVCGRTRGQGCPVCASNRYISKAEQEIADFIVSQGLAIMPSDKRTIKGMELDIYVPDKKIAIEYNGLYWHSDLKIADIKYHYNKWLRAKEAGIQLIQIWEDELNRNPEQIKAMLLHKLGISQQERIFARKTYVNTVTKSEAEEFFRENHVQGYASGSYYFGLREKATDTLVSVIAFKKEKGNALNIIRYATSKNVVGGFTKLMSMAERTLKPSSFVTFSDNCVSDGSLYANNGFIADKELAPDYRYVVKRERKHKFGYRLKKFREDPNLLWQEGLTERELAKLNGIPRIWDAGKIRWVRKTGIV